MNELEQIRRMGLYEVVTSRAGESYVRAYVWAEGNAEARAYFRRNYPDHEIDQVYFLFFARPEPFVTGLSASGFGGVQNVRT